MLLKSYPSDKSVDHSQGDKQNRVIGAALHLKDETTAHTNLHTCLLLGLV